MAQSHVSLKLLNNVNQDYQQSSNYIFTLSSLNYASFFFSVDKRAASSVSGGLFILSVYDGVFVSQLSYVPLKWQRAKNGTPVPVLWYM